MLNDLLWVSPWFTHSGERAVREAFKEEIEYGLRMGRIWQGLMGAPQGGRTVCPKAQS